MINRIKIPFTQIPNKVINNPELSAKAKGVYIYLMSKPNDWQFYESEIVKHFSDGKHSINVAVRELIKSNLLVRKQKRVQGKFDHYDWILNPTETDLSEVGKTETRKSDFGKSDTTNTNSSNTNNNNTNNRSIIRPKTKVFSQDIVNCLEACLRHFPDHLHPSTPKQKENALETIKRLNKIDKLPFEVVEEIVSKTRGDKFWCKNFLSINKLRKKNKEGIMYVVVFNEAIKSKPKPKTFKEIQQAHIEKIMSADVIKNHFR